jgi:hypothetical protein
MDSSFAIKLLDVLVENASRILAAGFGVNRAESSFFDIVKLLREEEALKEHFVERVRATFALRAPSPFDAGTVPIELVELVAHELRWPELLDLARERIDKLFGGEVSLAVGDVSYRLSGAYKDDWEDREFYDYYRA